MIQASGELIPALHGKTNTDSLRKQLIASASHVRKNCGLSVPNQKTALSQAVCTCCVKFPEPSASTCLRTGGRGWQAQGQREGHQLWGLVKNPFPALGCNGSEVEEASLKTMLVLFPDKPLPPNLGNSMEVGMGVAGHFYQGLYL